MIKHYIKNTSNVFKEFRFKNISIDIGVIIIVALLLITNLIVSLQVLFG
ncbi:hypothetical protein ACE939_06290 [Aquimarina sp. W85]